MHKYNTKNPRARVENLAHSEQLLCTPSVNLFDLNWVVA